MSANVAIHNGTPALFLDGRPAFASCLWSTPPTSESYPMAEVARRYADAGIHLYAFDVGVTGASPEWCGAHPDRVGQFDFTTVEAKFARVLEIDPDARFHLRVQLEMGREPGRWWRERHPEECELDSDGVRSTQSFASVVWRSQAREFLAAYIAHIRGLGLGDRVIAYQTGAGHTGEWVKGLTAMRSACGDFSVPMLQRFRNWLKDAYEEDVTALRDSWRDPQATFGTASVPVAEAQLSASGRTFRDPATEQPVIDYYRNLADLCAELIIDFNQTVKQATEGESLAGAFYGYLLELAWNAGFFSEGPDSDYSTYQRSGHLGLKKVLESPHVDFLVSPYSYGFRGIGGHGPSMMPTESLRVHGKACIYEDDTRTYLAPADAGFGRTDSLNDSAAVLRRNFAEVLIRGHGIWWSGGPNHVDPVQASFFQVLLERFRELGDFALALDRSPCAEIAVMVDDESFYYESLRNDLDRSLITGQRLWGLPRLGAPCDYYLLDDFLEGRIPHCKLCIFLNPFRLDRARREALSRELGGSGRTALWIYAPGYIDGIGGLEHMTEVTGYRFEQGDHAWGTRVHIVDFDHPITRDLPQDLSWGTDSLLQPLFHIEDLDARTLGQVVYSQGRCRPGFGIKAADGWQSVYSAAPNLPAPVLRGLARHAGVHVYNDAGDVLYASRQLLAVHTVSGGDRVFSLPFRAEIVYDLFAGESVAEDTDTLSVELPPRSTTLYYVGDRDLLKYLP